MYHCRYSNYYITGNNAFQAIRKINGNIRIWYISVIDRTINPVIVDTTELTDTEEKYSAFYNKFCKGIELWGGEIEAEVFKG